MEIKTERLLLRQWGEEDWPLFARLNADPDVMAFYPATLTRQESDALADKFSAIISEQGWGFWAVELLSDESFIGFVGLNRPSYELPINSCVEIGWRLAKEYWGKGYATEAALAALEFGFTQLDLSQIVSFTPVTNSKSQAVMERLNMVNTTSNFNHPMVPASSPLREHLLYKLDKQAWSAS